MLADAFGWTHPEMMRLSIRQVRAYHAQLERIRAAKALRMLDIVLAPNMKAEDITAFRRTLIQQASGAPPEEPRLIKTPAELAAFISGGRL